TTNNPDGATLPSFVMNYNCGLDTDGTTALTGSRTIASGSSATVSGIPTGNSCSATEVAPTAIPGFTWAAATYTPASIVIATTGGTFEIVVHNSISRDRGSLTITKLVEGGTFSGTFSGTVTCDGDGGNYPWSISYPVTGNTTISGIPTG